MSTDDQALQTSSDLRLSILGMRCAGCVSAVEGALAEVSGVNSVSVVEWIDESATPVAL